MRGNIAMPPLHASPCIISARQVRCSECGSRLAPLRFRRCTL